MKKAFLVLSAAILASVATAQTVGEDRVVANQGSLVSLSYNGAVQAFTIPAFLIKATNGGPSRTLTGVTIKVYQRPSYTLNISTNLPVNETFAYRVNATTTQTVLSDQGATLGSQSVTNSSSIRSGTLVNGVFSTALSYNGANDLVLATGTFPTRPNPSAAAKNITVNVSGTTSVTNLLFKTGGLTPTITTNPSPVTGNVTVVAIYTWSIP